MTELSIVIVCHKGWERLYKCLEALDMFSGENLKTEVIVVDNKSDDTTIDEIEKHFTKFRFIHNEVNGGFGNGCNLGARNAGGEYILFLNPDTVASESALERLVGISRQNPEFSILSCKQVNEKGKESVASGTFPSMFNLTGFQRAVFRRPASRISDLTPDISFPDWISGSVILIRNDTFKRIDGFDEDFWMYYEDVDLCKRTRNMGGEIAFCSNVSIEHNHGGSSRINLRTTTLTKTEVQISRHVYISKHKAGIEKLAIQTFLVINNLISGGIMALAGLLFFFLPKVFSRTLIYCRLIGYYTSSLFRFSWISERSVNFKGN
jgi:GT2 family glycosyltransferase